MSQRSEVRGQRAEVRGQRAEVRGQRSEVRGQRPAPSSDLRFLTSDIRPPTSEGGFTLIELMLVVIIIGALTAMVMPRLAGRTEQAKVSTAQADITANIATALKLYELDNGRYPTTEDGGLLALYTKPSNASNWNGPYLEKKPVDPWGREYKYTSPGTHRTYDYDLYSIGRDGVESEDDVKNWEN